MWPGTAPGENVVWPPTPGAQMGRHELGRQQTHLPGNRPGRWREPLAAAAPALLAGDSNPPVPAVAAEGGDSPAPAPERSCEAVLRLPWGPIDDCGKAVVASAVGATAFLSVLAWWGQGFHGDFSV
ncbi:MAG TPA: hypothetical protein PK177_18220, partial [Burkholderiaceae bacterium]|nr:hypothetical protein [Burkholderiaceae bacterium]